MVKRRDIQLPLVRRSSHLKVINEAKAAYDIKFHQLLEERDRLRNSFQDKITILEADRNRLLANAERIRSDLDRLRAEAERLRLLADERDAFAEQIADYESEIEALRALQSDMSDETSQLQREQKLLIRQKDDFKAECERLGVANVQMLHNNISLQNEKEELSRRLSTILARAPMLIGTFPRSGTWMLKYFLHFLDYYCDSDDTPKINEIYKRVTSHEHFNFNFGITDHHKQLITVSHWMCPGVFQLPEDKTRTFNNLLNKLGCFDYQYKKQKDHDHFAPGFGRSRIIFVYRNPFDVYRSYADIFERRAAMADRQPYPYNPMAPFATQLMNSESESPFEHFIDGFTESGFVEFFAAYFMSFLYVRDAYPGQVEIFRFEDGMADREQYLKDITEFGRIGDFGDGKFASAFSSAVSATDITQMRKYESELGHSLSGAVTFYGEENTTHLSVQKRNWRDIFSDRNKDFLCSRLQDYEPRILEFLPELK